MPHIKNDNEQNTSHRQNNSFTFYNHPIQIRGNIYKLFDIISVFQNMNLIEYPVYLEYASFLLFNTSNATYCTKI